MLTSLLLPLLPSLLLCPPWPICSIAILDSFLMVSTLMLSWPYAFLLALLPHDALLLLVSVPQALMLTLLF